MKRTLAIICLLLVAALGAFTAYHTQAVRVAEDIILVTIDAAPDYVIVVKTGKAPAVRVTRVKPVVVKPPANVVPKAAAAKWTLPYSCDDVKYYNSKFTKEHLEALRIAEGVAKPSADQLRQIDACIHDKL